jgi:hypothetical protein
MKAKKENKNDWFKFRISKGEKEILQKQAQLHQMSLSELVRSHVINNTKTN